MTTLTITLVLPEATEPVDGETEIVTWGRLEELLTKYYLPTNKDLEIRKGLSGAIKADLMIGKLTIDVTEPYVEPTVYAAGTIAHNPHTNVSYVKGADEGWLGVYHYSTHSESCHRSDECVQDHLDSGRATIVFDPKH